MLAAGRTGLIRSESVEIEVLTVLLKVLDEVGLRLQLPLQLLRLHEADGALLALLDLAALHCVLIGKFINI